MSVSQEPCDLPEEIGNGKQYENGVLAFLIENPGKKSKKSFSQVQKQEIIKSLAIVNRC
jgi:hypothetical protein